jgi:hypothetical protein
MSSVVLGKESEEDIDELIAEGKGGCYSQSRNSLRNDSVWEGRSFQWERDLGTYIWYWRC